VRNGRRLQASKTFLKLVPVFLEMNDAIRNGYPRCAAAPPVSNEPRILATGPTAAFSIGNCVDGTLRRIPTIWGSCTFKLHLQRYFTGSWLRHFLP
jgi:hypothetical protein